MLYRRHSVQEEGTSFDTLEGEAEGRCGMHLCVHVTTLHARTKPQLPPRSPLVIASF